MCAECLHNLDLKRQTIRRLLFFRYHNLCDSAPSARWIVSFCSWSEDCWCAGVSVSIVSNFDDCILHSMLASCRCHFSRRETELILPTIVSRRIWYSLSNVDEELHIFRETRTIPTIRFECWRSIYLCLVHFSPFASAIRDDTPHKSEDIIERNGKKRNQALSTENLGDVVVYWNGDNMCLWHISSSDRWHNISEILFVFVSFCWCCLRCAVVSLANCHQFRCYDRIVFFFCL